MFLTPPMTCDRILAMRTAWRIVVVSLAVQGLSFAGEGAPMRPRPSSAPAETRLPKGARLAAPDGHMAKVNCLSFSPDGRQLLSGSTDQSLLVWDVQTGELVRRLKGHHGFVTACEFLPDGRHAVSAGWGGEVFVWQLDTGKVVPLAGVSRAEDVYSLGIRPDGSELAVGTDHGRVYAWDLATGQAARTVDVWPDGSRRIIWSIRFRSGAWLEASGDQGTVALTTRSSGQKAILSTVAVGAELVLSDGRLLVGRRNGVFILDKDGHESQLGTHSNGVVALAATPQEDAILAGDGSGTARLWDLKTHLQRCELHLPAGIFAAAIDPQAQLFSLAGDDNVVRLYQLRDCQPRVSLKAVHELLPRRSRISRLAISGQRLGVGDGTGRLSLWNTSSRRLEDDEAVHKGEIEALVALSQDEWVSGGADGTVFLSTARLGGPMSAQQLGQMSNVAYAIQPLTGGRDVLVGDLGGYVARFSIADRTVHVVLNTGNEVAVMTSFPKKDAFLIGGEGTHFYRYEAATDQARSMWESELLEPGDTTTTVAFSPKGEILAQGSVFGAVQMRSAKDGDVLSRLKGLDVGVYGLLFASDATLWGADGSGNLAMWALDRSTDAPAFHTNLGSGVNGLVKDPGQPRLYAALDDGRVVELSLPKAERVADLIPLRDGSWATVYADGRLFTEGTLARGLQFELPDRRVIDPAGKSGQPRFSTPLTDRLQSGLVRVKTTVFSPGGPPRIVLDSGTALSSLVPSKTVSSAYELEFFMRDTLGGNHALTATDPLRQSKSVQFRLAADLAQGSGAAPSLKALLIGNHHYKTNIPLPGSTEDATNFERFLTEEPRGLRLPHEAVQTRLDLDKDKLHSEAKSFFEQATKEQTLLFYFSGHGTSDSEQGYLLAVGDDSESTKDALSARELWGYIKTCPADRVVVILDACRSGAFMIPPSLEREINGHGRVLLLTATAPGREAMDGNRGGTYTRAFLEAALDAQAVDRELHAVTLWRAHHRAAIDLVDQGPLILGSPEVGRLVIAAPAMQQERLAQLTKTNEALAFHGIPEILRPRQVAIGAQTLFQGSGNRSIEFDVVVGQATNVVRASVARRAVNAVPCTEDIEERGMFPTGTTLKVDLPLGNCAAGDYELHVQPCRASGTCDPGPVATFKLE